MRGRTEAELLCIDMLGLDINPQLEQGNLNFGNYGHQGVGRKTGES